MFGLTLATHRNPSLRVAGVVGWLFALMIVAGCGGSSTPSTSSGTQQATATINAPQSSGQPTFDIVISGGLQAEWKSGANDGSGATCLFPSDGTDDVSLYGQIGGKPYGLGIRQDQFQAATFSYPVTGSGTANAAVPFVQIATTSNSSVDWTADNFGEGSGTAKITGGGSTPVSVALDLDLTPRGGVSLAHVKGTLVCPPS